MNKRGLKNDGTPDLRGAKKKHGLITHPLYDVWGSMKRRCYNPKERAYKWYGALGITICQQWLSDFKAFYDWAIANGYKNGLSIERIKNSLGYSPENCTWIKRTDQNKNRTNNHQINYKGEIKILAEWSRIIGFDYMLVLQRLKLGWDFDKAISKPSLQSITQNKTKPMNGDTYFERLQKIKLGQLPKEAVAKEKKPLKKIGDKKAAEIKEAKEVLGEDDTMKEKWFQARRKEMVGVCQCGCGQPSQKKDDMWFRSSVCHILPQRIFESVQFHKLNWVERRFWGGCHSNMDNKSMDLWPKMADWDDIKEKFHHLAPLLTDEERTTKFYKHLEKLIYEN